MGSYIPNTGKEQLEMLKSMGYSSMDDLFAAIPDDMKLKAACISRKENPNWKSAVSWRESLQKTEVFSSIFRGAGAYNHYIPAIVGSVISQRKACRQPTLRTRLRSARVCSSPSSNIRR